MTTRRFYLLAYDIADHGRRARALKACKAHGLGGQKSVHECWLSAREKRDLERTLRAIIDPETDRFLILRFPPKNNIKTLGTATPLPDPPWFCID